MIILKATTESIQVTTSTASAVDISASYADITTTTFNPSTNEVKITSATTTASVVASPAASTQRQVKLISISNKDAALSNVIVVQKLISSTTYNLTPSITLLAGETVQYMDGAGWTYYSATGAIKGSQTAAGSNMQIQFNNSGTLSADPDLTWNSTSNTLTLSTSPQIVIGGVAAGNGGTPAVPPAGYLQIYSQAIAGKMTLMKQGPGGDFEALQAAIWANNVVLWTPGSAAGTWLGTAGAVTGTNSTGTQATTNLFTIMKRSTFANTATAQTTGGLYTENMFIRGAAAGMGGFLFICRFGLNTWTTGSRLFVGLTSATTASSPTKITLLGAEITTASNIGFYIGASDTAISFLHVDGTPTVTKDPITTQPTLATNNGYDAYIWCRPNDTTVYYRLDNALTGATLIDSSTTTTLPVNTTFLAGIAEIGGGASTTAGSATLGVNRMYVETNR